MTEEKTEDYKIACKERDKIIQKLSEKIRKVKDELKEQKAELEIRDKEILLLKNTQLTEEEVDTIYKKYPKLKKLLEIKSKQIERRLDKLEEIAWKNKSSSKCENE